MVEPASVLSGDLLQGCCAQCQRRVSERQHSASTAHPASLAQCNHSPDALRSAFSHLRREFAKNGGLLGVSPSPQCHA